MKILLTGYTGLLGRHIARALKQHGHVVRTVLHQRTVSRKDIRAEVDDILWGSLEEPAILARAVAGVDVVVHSAWKFSKQGDPRPTSNELVTEALFNESLRVGVRQFLFVSSVSVYGMSSRNSVVVTEDAPLASPDNGFIYPSEKVRMETLLRSYDRGTMKLGIVRPGPIFDDGKGPMKKIISIGSKKLALGFGTGRNPMPYIHAADVASGIVAWLERGADGGVYNLTPSQCLAARDWYRVWGDVRGFKVSPFFVRSFVLRGAAAMATLLKRLLGKKGRVDVDYVIASATRALTYSNNRAVQELAWKPVHTEPAHAPGK